MSRMQNLHRGRVFMLDGWEVRSYAIIPSLPFIPFLEGKSVENLLSVGYITNFPFNPNPPEHPVTSHRWPVTARPPQTSTRRGQQPATKNTDAGKTTFYLCVSIAPPAFIHAIASRIAWTKFHSTLNNCDLLTFWTRFLSSNAHFSRLLYPAVAPPHVIDCFVVAVSAFVERVLGLHHHIFSSTSGASAWIESSSTHRWISW